MSEGIILPADMSPEALRKLAGDQPETAETRAAAGAAEGREIVAEINEVMLTDIAPYKDDAPICDAQTELQSVARETSYNKIVQMPAWAHGRCIGSSCGRWKNTVSGPICGRALQDMAAGFTLGFMSGSDFDNEFARWAHPAAEAPAPAADAPEEPAE